MHLAKLALIMAMVAAGAAQAQGDIYLCINDKGVKEYRNTDITKNCKKMALPAGTVIAAPITTHKASPADGPRIDSSTQKGRDTERQQILLDELQREERRLVALRQEFNQGEPERRGDERNYAKYQERVAAMKDEVARTEKNIEALKREMRK